MNSDNFSNNTNSVTISYELLCLLRWLIDHSEEKIKKIITDAFNAGLSNELSKLKDQSDLKLHDIQNSISDFLILLESLLLKTTNEQIDKMAKVQKLLPAIDKIDTSIFDDHLLKFSIEKTTEKIILNPKKNAKDLLYKEILKHWKPNKKIQTN